ncbi:MAG: hypothetical protein AAFX01_07125 [Cyanobacteria bacterium J06638_28]
MNYQPLIMGALCSLLSLPAVAHQVQVAEDVGATLHIEPDDIPKAGTPTEVWIALTQPGGIVIPLETCDCSLTLVDADDAAIAMPELVPVSAEGYAGIPGATVTFPTVGAYELVLTGSPTAGAEFTPFDLRFDVTVAAQANASSSDVEAEPNEVEGEPDTPEGESDTASTTETATIPETPPQTPSSFRVMSGVIPVLGMLGITAGILWRILGGKRSPGGKA